MTRMKYYITIKKLNESERKFKETTLDTFFRFISFNFV